jgi:thiol reductant ABC exporter CydC subunit
VYGREEEALDRVHLADRALARLTRRDALAAGVADGLGILVTGATTIGVLAVAVSANHAGQLNRVLVAVLALLALASFEAVAPLPLAARELSTTLAAGRRVLELTQREPSVRDPAQPVPLADPRPALAFEGVGVSYAPGEPRVLDGFGLALPPGRKVALVGPSGAGKTTVVNLLLRFLDPAEGRVTLGGHDLRDLRQEDVRSAVAVAGQDAHVFSTTIRANVRLAKPEASEKEVEAALGQARIWDWVTSLPEGLETLVGEEGTQLSGGQRQRIALARAFLADTPILVLDEPTSQLDPETAERLVEDVLAGADGRTVLLITHRPEGLDLVDEVVTLEGGRAVAA